MAQEIDPLLMLATAANDGVGTFQERSQRPRKQAREEDRDTCFSSYEAQDHCYVRREECDLVVNAEHNYYNRINQADQPQLVEHSYALNIPPKDVYKPKAKDYFEVVELSLQFCRWNACQYMCDTVHELNHHIRKAHLSGKYTYGCCWKMCSRNRRPFQYRYLLERHMSSHIHHTDFYCDDCGQAFITAERLHLHVNAKHKHEVRYECPQCLEMFKTTSDRANHMKRIHLKVRHPCPNCEKLYAGRSALRVHLKKCSKKVPAVAKGTTASSS